MSTYAKITDFASKDALLTGNPSKIVKGTEIGAEFDSIAAADASNVKGPTSAVTDNAVVRWDTTTGRIAQGSGVTIDDSNVLTASGFAGPLNGTVGATTPSTGAFTTLSATGTVTAGGSGVNIPDAQSAYYGAGSAYVQGSSAGNYVRIGVGSGVIGAFSGTGLAVTGALSSTGLLTSNVAATGYMQYWQAGGVYVGGVYYDGSNLQIGAAKAGVPLQFNTGAGAVQATLDTAGNLGLGVIPTNLYTSGKSIDITNGHKIYGSQTTASYLQNATLDASGNALYQVSAAAGNYKITGGQHAWYSAPSGTAGNPIAFTQAMTLTSASELNIDSGTSGGRLTFTPTGASNTISSTTTGFSAYSTFKTKASDYQWLIGASTQAMTLDASGNLLVGTTSTSVPTSGFAVQPNGAAAGATQWIVGHASGSASGTGFGYFQYNGGAIGSITQSGTTAVLYNTTSDQRLKANIKDADSANPLIDQIQVRQYDWKSDGSHQRYGFIAQELVQVFPEAVHQPSDTEDMMAVDYSKLVPLLLKEVQELRARLNAAGIA